MSKYSTIIGLGIFVALMPFLGFPLVVKDVFFVIIGLAIAVIAYFSNIQYCNNCNRLVENGKHGIGTPTHTGGNKQPAVGGEVSNLPERLPAALHSAQVGGRSPARAYPHAGGQSGKDNTGMST